MKETQSSQDLENIFVEVTQYLQWFWQAKRLKSKDQAQDLAQEGVLQGWENLDCFRGRSSLKTYLITVGINRGKDFLKKEVRQDKILARQTEINEAVLLRVRCGRRRREDPRRSFDG